MKSYKQFIKEHNSFDIVEYDEYKHNDDEYADDVQDEDIISDVFEDIKKNCQEYLNMLQIDGKILWRGMDIDKDIDIITPLKDRKPKDSPELIQNILDDLFEEKFGIRPRSQGTFAFQTESRFKQYGPEYMIFPFDGFKYVWSYDVVDFYTTLKNMIGYTGIEYLKLYDINDDEMLIDYYNKTQSRMLNEDDISNLDEWKKNMSLDNIKEKLKKIVEDYQDTDLDYLLKKGTNDKEVCIVCDKYYAIYEDYKYLVFDKIKEYITTKK